MAIVEGRYYKGSMTDKSYEADGLAEYCRRFLSSGVLDSGANLQVSAGEGMSIHVNFGDALVDGYLCRIKDNGTGPLQLELEPSDSLRRIDRVVLHKDPTMLRITACIKKGTPAASPVAPPLDGNEVSLARIRVSANVMKISAEDIFDERHEAVVHAGAIFFQPDGIGIGIGGAADADELQVYTPAVFKDTLKVGTKDVALQESANRPGITRLYRSDSDDAYNVRTRWDGSYWVLEGFYHDNLHAGARVQYANTTGNADTIDGFHASNWIKGYRSVTPYTYDNGNVYTSPAIHGWDCPCLWEFRVWTCPNIDGSSLYKTVLIYHVAIVMDYYNGAVQYKISLKEISSHQGGAGLTITAQALWNNTWTEHTQAEDAYIIFRVMGHLSNPGSLFKCEAIRLI